MSDGKVLSWQEGMERVLEAVPPPEARSLDLPSACGHVCAEDLFSPMDLPAFSNSAMDGYAVVASDTAGASPQAPAKLSVIGQVRAGTVFAKEVRPGQTVEIMTGAPLPPGADAVVQVEVTRRSEPQSVEILSPVSQGTYVRPAGQDSRRGQRLVAAGTVLTPASVGLLAACGIAQVRVYRRLLPALAVSGDELLSASNQTPRLGGQIYDANSPMLLSLVRSWGFESRFLGHLPDTPEALVQQLENALAHEVVLTTGGVSVGRFDFLRATLKRLGCEEIFWQLNQQPGGPLLLARRGKTVVFGLPGNPVSCFTCAELYLRPFLLKAAGVHACQPPVLRLRLLEPLAKSSSKTGFLRARLERDGNVLGVRTTGAQDSHLISSLVGHDGYILFPEKKTRLQAGETVEFILMNAPGFARWAAEVLNEAI